MQRENFYVITGGPGAGKTSLLDSLASKGFSCIAETARQIIKERLSKGLPPRPDPQTFAQGIFDNDYLNFTRNSKLNSTLFFDRSMLDSAWQLFKANRATYGAIKNFIIQNRYNKRVFFAPPWKEIYTPDSERDHTYEESIEIYGELKQWYVQHQYEIIAIPKTTIEERVTFILKYLPAN